MLRRTLANTQAWACRRRTASWIAASGVLAPKVATRHPLALKQGAEQLERQVMSFAGRAGKDDHTGVAGRPSL